MGGGGGGGGVGGLDLSPHRIHASSSKQDRL